MSLQLAPKTISATISLPDLRQIDAEIQNFLTLRSDPASVGEYLKRRYRNSDKLDVRVADNVAQLHWSGPIADTAAEQLHQEALAFARKKDFVHAITKWTQAVARTPNNPEYYFNLGIAFFESKNYKEAIENLQQTLAICPIYPRAHLILGTILLKMRKFVEAENHLKESIYFSPPNALAFLNLGAVYSILKKYKEGVASFQRAIELSPGEVRAYFGLAKIFSLLGDVENANLNYRKVVELDKKGVLANHAKRGIVVSSVTPTVEIEDLESLYAEGYKSFLYSDFKTAVTMYQKYLQKKPEDDHVWSALGVALQRAGSPGQAAKAMEQAIRINPAKALYFKQLAISHDLMDNAQAVAEALAKANELGKEDSVSLSLWGKNLIKLNRLTEAIPLLERSVKANKANLLAHYHLAVALMRMNELDRAAAHLQAVMSAKVNTPLKEEAQSLFKRIRAH